jgi:hypothetical protein
MDTKKNDDMLLVPSASDDYVVRVRRLLTFGTKGYAIWVLFMLFLGYYLSRATIYVIRMVTVDCDAFRYQDLMV